jgi:tripartite-type tricarboxylate transporter receptor subunit TctC
MLGVKNGTPKPIVSRLHEAITLATREPKFKEFTENIGLIDGYLPLAQFKEFLRRTAAKNKDILQSLGIETK